MGISSTVGYNREVPTRFPQPDPIAVRATAVREMCQPPLRYLAGHAIGALVIAARAAILMRLPRVPRWIIREDPDQLGYRLERLYTHKEVTDHLQKTWGIRVKQLARPKPR